MKKYHRYGRNPTLCPPVPFTSLAKSTKSSVRQFIFNIMNDRGSFQYIATWLSFHYWLFPEALWCYLGGKRDRQGWDKVDKRQGRQDLISNDAVPRHLVVDHQHHTNETLCNRKIRRTACNKYNIHLSQGRLHILHLTWGGAVQRRQDAVEDALEPVSEDAEELC